MGALGMLKLFNSNGRFPEVLYTAKYQQWVFDGIGGKINLFSWTLHTREGSAKIGDYRSVTEMGLKDSVKVLYLC
jgi:hypothetical protein